MLIGYARTSTSDQKAGLDAQLKALQKAGAEKTFSEQVSSVAERTKLAAAIEFAREGDTLIVSKLDRLARSVRDLGEIVAGLERKGVALRILDFGGDAVDTRSATGRFLLTVFGAVAEMERALMLERQREGIARAKAEGKYKGRAPTAMAKADDVKRLAKEGVRPAEIARKIGISRASVYRVLSA